MRKPLKCRFSMLLAPMLLLAVFCLGCGDKAGQSASEDQEKTTGYAAVDAAAVRSKLAKADLVDGTADKVVSKCGSCALGMDGEPEHALQESGYTLQFCSSYCKESFEKDIEKSILAMNVPAG